MEQEPPIETLTGWRLRERLAPKEGSLRDLCPCLTCGMCAHFCVFAADKGHWEHCGKADHCRRLDFRRVTHFGGINGDFVGLDSRDICPEFVIRPRSAPWLEARWRGWEDYWGEDYIAWVRSSPIPLVALEVKGESWCYLVRRRDWWGNTHLDADGNPRWVKRWRYPSRGWRVIWETRET